MLFSWPMLTSPSSLSSNPCFLISSSLKDLTMLLKIYSIPLCHPSIQEFSKILPSSWTFSSIKWNSPWKTRPTKRFYHNFSKATKWLRWSATVVVKNVREFKLSSHTALRSKGNTTFTQHWRECKLDSWSVTAYVNHAALVRTQPKEMSSTWYPMSSLFTWKEWSSTMIFLWIPRSILDSSSLMNLTSNPTQKKVFNWDRNWESST